MATNKDILVAAIGYGHLSTVALMKNGELVFALSEERLRRIKNYVGFPHLAYAELLKRFCSGNPDAIDSIILPTNSNQEYAFYIESGKFDDGRYFDLYRKTESNSVPDFFLNRTLNTFDAYIRKDREEFETFENRLRLPNVLFSSTRSKP